MPCFAWSKTSLVLHRDHEENKVEFLEGQFRNEKLSFVHKNKTEYSFELSLSICVFFLCNGAAPRSRRLRYYRHYDYFSYFIVPRFVELLLRFLVRPASILTTAFGVPNIFISLCSASAMFAVLQINSMNATRNSLSLNE